MCSQVRHLRARVLIGSEFNAFNNGAHVEHLTMTNVLIQCCQKTRTASLDGHNLTMCMMYLSPKQQLVFALNISTAHFFALEMQIDFR